MAQPTMSAIARLSSRLTLLVVITVYLVVSLEGLAVYPPVGEDEPWIAAAPYKLATDGVYGSDLFAGYYGVERHNYQHMPLYPLAQAAVFKTFGVGVFQMRLLPVACGLALLVVVYLLGARVGDERVGAVAAVLLIGLRVAHNDVGTGILLLDRARINRYDIAVPVFGLLAILALLRANRVNADRWYVATGALIGLASLSHLFGGFWLPIVLASIGVDAFRIGRRVRPAALVLAGFVLPWVPWLAFVATGWDDFVGQMRFVSPRFDLLSPSFYLGNAIYRDGPMSLRWIFHAVRDLEFDRVGAWTLIYGLPAATLALAWTARAKPDQTRLARWLGLAAFAQFVMFLVLLHVKTINYMIGIWPLATLLLAWLGVWLWDRRRAWLRALVIAMLLGVIVEGGTRVASARTAARQTLPYDWYATEIAACIPAGARVLGLQHYWLGLRQFEYRTWLMALNLSHPIYYHAPMALDDALERMDPDVILIDRHMAALFEAAANPAHRFHHMQVGYEAFVARRRVEPVCVIRNRTYGSMTVYRVPTTPGS